MTVRRLFTMTTQDGMLDMKYWPVVLFCLVVLGSTTGFYYDTKQSVEKIEMMLPLLVQKDNLAMELRFRDKIIDTLDIKVDANSDRTAKQFEVITKQLNNITNLLIDSDMRND